MHRFVFPLVSVSLGNHGARIQTTRSTSSDSDLNIWPNFLSRGHRPVDAMANVLLASAVERKPRKVVQRIRVPCMQEAEATALRNAWKRGDSAIALRPLVEAAARTSKAREAAIDISSTSADWAGLWVARIEHFEKVRFLGLRVRPHYDISASGQVISHVHIRLGPLKGWASASGVMMPAADQTPNVKLIFDDFWISADAERPRGAPDGFEVGFLDQAVRALGRSFFFEDLALFPVDFIDKETGLVSFRFTPLDSCIVAQRAPKGELPQRCAD